MNTQQMMEEIDRLARLCEAKDEEIARITHDRDAKSERMWELGHECDSLETQLSEAQAQIAMQSVALKAVKRDLIENDDTYLSQNVINILDTAIFATSETVAAWKAKDIGECTRSHPHELMSPMCKLRTEIARLTSHLATAQAETESLRREVAMLINAGKELCKKLDVLPFNNQVDSEYVQLRDAMYSAKATEIAYEREVENRGAVKALERIIQGGCDLDFIEAVLEERRSANKGVSEMSEQEPDQIDMMSENELRAEFRKVLIELAKLQRKINRAYAAQQDAEQRELDCCHDLDAAVAENAELTRKLAEQQAYLDAHEAPEFLSEFGREELTKLLAEAKSKAVPEGYVMVPMELSDGIRCVMIDQAHNIQRGMVMRYQSMWEAMLAAAPQPGGSNE